MVSPDEEGSEAVRTKSVRIAEMHDKGFSDHEICDRLEVTHGYVRKVIESRAKGVFLGHNPGSNGDETVYDVYDTCGTRLLWTGTRREAAAHNVTQSRMQHAVNRGRRGEVPTRRRTLYAVPHEA